jgi:hypothetical protein
MTHRVSDSNGILMRAFSMKMPAQRLGLRVEGLGLRLHEGILNKYVRTHTRRPVVRSGQHAKTGWGFRGFGFRVYG